MKVYEALAKGFVAEGTTAFFGLMGDTTQSWINAMHRLGSTGYVVRHEGPGLGMAEAWSHITGGVGVVTTTSGPGVTQLATTMIVASRSEIPLIAFCGDARWGDVDDHHALDEERFAAAMECGFVRVTSPATAFESVQRAFYLARLESRPIMLSAPLDVQNMEFDEDEEYTLSTELIKNAPIYPNPNSFAAALDIIERSERPVLVVGRGAIHAGADDVVCRVAERLGALITTSLMAMNWPRDAGPYQVGISGLYSTRTALEYFREADCVIGVGASLNHYTTAHGYAYPNATFVHLDAKSQVIMGDNRSADCYVQCDAKLGLEVLEKALEERGIKKTGYRTPEVKERLATAFDDPAVFEIEPGTVDPRDVSRLIDSLVPANIGFVISGGHASQFAMTLCRTPRPFTLVNKTFGSMGKGIAEGIGAAIATGEPTVLFEGDIGLMMHLAEFETAVRYKLPLLVICQNNQALGSELHKAQHSDELDEELTRVSSPDLGLVGVALGGRGHLVRTIADLESAVKEFLAEPGPMLIDVRFSSKVESIQKRRGIGVEDA